MLEVARSQTAFGLNKILIRRPSPRRNRHVRTKAIELNPGLGDRRRETVALRRSESAPPRPCYRGRNARRYRTGVFPTKVPKVPQDFCQVPIRKGFSAIL